MSSAARNIRLLGWFHVVVDGLVLLAGLAVSVHIALSSGMESYAAQAIVSTFFFLVIPCFLPGLIGGIGLLKQRRWARIVIIILSAIQLVWIPIGTVLGGFGLWVLLGRGSEAAFAPSGAGAPKAFISADVAPRPILSLGLILMAAGIGAGFIAFLGAGFMISGDPAPSEFSMLFYPALAVLSFAIAYGVRHLAMQGWRPSVPNLNPPWSPLAMASEAMTRRKFAELERQRLARLAADPVRRKYVALIQRGESWSDEQIDYDLVLARTVTCPHLRPVEQAMRSAGIRVKRHAGAQASAHCIVDADRLKRDFDPSVSATYSEFEHYDRSPEPSLVAQFWCPACSSSLEVVHPRTAAPATPTFPR